MMRTSRRTWPLRCTMLFTAPFAVSSLPSAAVAGEDGNKCDGDGKQAALAIIEGAKVAAAATPSPIRGTPNTQMRIAVGGRSGKLCVEDTTSPDAWLGSISIARGKAFTAVAFSSNQNSSAVETLAFWRAKTVPAQPSRPIWGPDTGVAPLFGIGDSNRDRLGIITFAGGVPIYNGSILVGAIGVSGDGVDEDEHVAICGVENASGNTGVTTPSSPPLGPCE